MTMSILTHDLLDHAHGGDDEYAGDSGGGDTGGGDYSGGGDTGGGYDQSGSEPSQSFDAGGGDVGGGDQSFGGGDVGGGDQSFGGGDQSFGGGDQSFGGGDTPMNDFGTDADFQIAGQHHSPTDTSPSVDPEHQLSQLPMPDPITEPPHIDPPTPEQIAAGPTPQQRFDAQVDIAQNYQDLASPSQLYQGGRNDCFNIAAINALNANDPEAMQMRVQQTNDPNVMQVFSEGRQGNPDSTYVNPWQLGPVGPQRHQEPEYNYMGQDLRGGAVSDDPSLQSIYNATTQRYHPSQPGGNPEDAMQRLGANTYSSDSASEIAQMYRDGQGGAVLGTHPEGSMSPEMQQLYQQYNLQPWHAYQVSSVIRNEADGRDYVVLTNPHAPYTDGSPRHPQPIPLEDANRLLPYGAIGRLRR